MMAATRWRWTEEKVCWVSCAHVLHILQIFCVHVLLHVPQINSRNVLSVSCWALSFSVSYKCLEGEPVEGWRQLEVRHVVQPWEKKKQTSSNLKWSVNKWLISWSRMYWFSCWSEEHLIHFLSFWKKLFLRRWNKVFIILWLFFYDALTLLFPTCWKRAVKFFFYLSPPQQRFF